MKKLFLLFLVTINIVHISIGSEHNKTKTATIGPDIGCTIVKDNDHVLIKLNHEKEAPGRKNNQMSSAFICALTLLGLKYSASLEFNTNFSSKKANQPVSTWSCLNWLALSIELPVFLYNLIKFSEITATNIANNGNPFCNKYKTTTLLHIMPNTKKIEISNNLSPFTIPVYGPFLSGDDISLKKAASAYVDNETDKNPDFEELVRNSSNFSEFWNEYYKKDLNQ